MKFIEIVTIVVLALLIACGETLDRQAVESVVLSSPKAEAAAAKTKPDMKKMFGQDYKKGDIGHSTGVIMSILENGDLVIEHGMVHGTSVTANTTGFELMDSVDITELSESNRVEFLVKKGEDSVYRVLKICQLRAGSAKCL